MYFIFILFIVTEGYYINSLNFNISFDNFNNTEIRNLIQGIDITINRFNSTIGITRSIYNHQCLITTKQQTNNNLGEYSIQSIINKTIYSKISIVKELNIDNHVLIHEMAHAIQFYMTDGKYIRPMLIEGIASYIENYTNYIDQTSTILRSNWAIKYYNEEQFINHNKNPYIIGPAIINYLILHYKVDFYNALMCVRTNPEDICINNLLTRFEVESFQRWILTVGKDLGYKETSLVFIRNSTYSIYACDDYMLSVIDKQYNKFEFMDKCYKFYNNYIPYVNTVLYYKQYKINYNKDKVYLTENDKMICQNISTFIYGKFQILYYQIYNKLNYQQDLEDLIKYLKKTCYLKHINIYCNIECVVDCVDCTSNDLEIIIVHRKKQHIKYICNLEWSSWVINNIINKTIKYNNLEQIYQGCHLVTKTTDLNYIIIVIFICLIILLIVLITIYILWFK